MHLTPDQLQEIARIIAERHTAFIANTQGVDSLPPEVIERLRQMGLLNVKIDSVQDAYLYGQLAAAGLVPGVRTMTYPQFKAYIHKNPIPLTPIEQSAIQAIRYRGGQYLKGLGNRVNVQTGEVIINADADLRREMRDTTKTITEQGIAQRKTRDQIKSDLGWATKDWTRDWRRISNTDSSYGMGQGTKDYIVKRHGPQAKVAVRVAPDCCEKCCQLFKRGEIPIIFELEDLEGNGTNHGRKQADWQPVVPPVHPHCRCLLIHVPPGFGFDEQGRMVVGGERVELGKSEAYWALRRENDFHKALRTAKHIEFQGIPIVIENPVGSIRKWSDGEESGQTPMLFAYGYIVGTEGADTEEIDVFVGPDLGASQAYIIHQQNPKTGVYDEDKVMLGFGSEQSALNAYRLHYNRPDFAVAVSPLPVDHLKRWVAGTAPRPEGFIGGPRPLVVVPPSSPTEPLTKGEDPVRAELPSREEAPKGPKLVLDPSLSKARVKSGDAMAVEFSEDVPTANQPTSKTGSGASLVLGCPPPTRLPPVDLKTSPNPYRQDAPEGRLTPRKAPPGVYTYEEPVKPRKQDLELADLYEGSILGIGVGRANKAQIDEHAKQRKASIENKVPKTKDDEDDEDKIPDTEVLH